MNRRIEGTYQTPEEVVKAVERLLNEGYVGEEIVVITDSKSSHQHELDNLTLVEVDSVDANENLSFWDKAKEMLSFGNYNADEDGGPLTEHGIGEEDAHSYNESLKKGDILLLVDQDAPKNKKNTFNNNASDLAHGVSGNSPIQEDASIDQSKEEMKEAYEPTPGENETFDPSKAQSSREDQPSEGNDNDSADIPPHSIDIQQDTEEKGEPAEENENLLDDEEAPQLTGDETSVTLREGTHVYQENVNTGFTEGANKDPIESPLNGTPKVEEDPSKYVNEPQSDAYYSDEYKNAGGKSIEDDEKK